MFDLYGPESQIKGTVAFNCLLARRLIERDVRFVQLFHMGWDQHENLPKDMASQCRDTDQPTAALIKDLKQQFENDIPIWENKAYHQRPVLFEGGGPLSNYRKWYSQFV